MTFRKVTKYVVVGIVLLFIFNTILKSTHIGPHAWTPPQKPKLEGILKTNELLQKTEWIDLKGWYGPEDIAIDKAENLYCGVHEKNDFEHGTIVEIDKSGTLSVFCDTEKWVAGLHLSTTGEILKTYCDTSAERVPEASSVEEQDGILYWGGDVIGHIEKYKL